TAAPWNNLGTVDGRFMSVNAERCRKRWFPAAKHCIHPARIVRSMWQTYSPAYEAAPTSVRHVRCQASSCNPGHAARENCHACSVSRRGDLGDRDSPHRRPCDHLRVAAKAAFLVPQERHLPLV